MEKSKKSLKSPRRTLETLSKSHLLKSKELGEGGEEALREEERLPEDNRTLVFTPLSSPPLPRSRSLSNSNSNSKPRLSSSNKPPLSLSKKRLRSSTSPPYSNNNHHHHNNEEDDEEAESPRRKEDFNPLKRARFIAPSSKVKSKRRKGSLFTWEVLFEEEGVRLGIFDFCSLLDLCRWSLVSPLFHKWISQETVYRRRLSRLYSPEGVSKGSPLLSWINEYTYEYLVLKYAHNPSLKKYLYNSSLPPKKKVPELCYKFIEYTIPTGLNFYSWKELVTRLERVEAAWRDPQRHLERCEEIERLPLKAPENTSRLALSFDGSLLACGCQEEIRLFRRLPNDSDYETVLLAPRSLSGKWSQQILVSPCGQWVVNLFLNTLTTYFVPHLPFQDVDEVLEGKEGADFGIIPTISYPFLSPPTPSTHSASKKSNASSNSNPNPPHKLTIDIGKCHLLHVANDEADEYNGVFSCMVLFYSRYDEAIYRVHMEAKRSLPNERHTLKRPRGTSSSSAIWSPEAVKNTLLYRIDMAPYRNTDIAQNFLKAHCDGKIVLLQSLNGYITVFDLETGQIIHPLLCLGMDPLTSPFVRSVIALHLPYPKNTFAVGEYSSSSFGIRFYEFPQSAYPLVRNGNYSNDQAHYAKKKAVPSFEKLRLEEKGILKAKAKILRNGMDQADVIHYSGEKVYALLSSCATVVIWDAKTGKIVSQQTTDEIPLLINPVLSQDGGILAANLRLENSPLKSKVLFSFEYHVQNKILEEEEEEEEKKKKKKKKKKGNERDEEEEEEEDEEEEGEGEEEEKRKKKGKKKRVVKRVTPRKPGGNKKSSKKNPSKK